MQVPPPTPEFLEAADRFGISFDQGDLDRLHAFLSLLYAANAHTNLTAIKDPDQAWMKHIFDALTLLPTLDDLPDAPSLLDIGTGGGVPGIPLAIARPDLKVTMLDATAKKAALVESFADELSLDNARVVTGRAESLAAHPAGELRDAFDVVTARALGRVAVAAELCVPCAKVGGRIVLVKGEKAPQELEEARPALHMLHATYIDTLPTPTGQIVVLDKARPTPKKYPRRDGEPKRAPLGVSDQPA